MSALPVAQVMISVHCATMLTSANSLKNYLRERRYTVFLCDSINLGDNFRDAICLNAAQCSFFIPFVNEQWCSSKECAYEFNITLANNRRSGTPIIIPIFLESFDFFRTNISKYPVAFSLTCNFHGFLSTPGELDDKLWLKIVDSISGRQGEAEMIAAPDVTRTNTVRNLAPPPPKTTTAAAPPAKPNKQTAGDLVGKSKKFMEENLTLPKNMAKLESSLKKAEKLLPKAVQEKFAEISIKNDSEKKVVVKKELSASKVSDAANKLAPLLAVPIHRAVAPSPPSKAHEPSSSSPSSSSFSSSPSAVPPKQSETPPAVVASPRTEVKWNKTAASGDKQTKLENTSAKPSPPPKPLSKVSRQNVSHPTLASPSAPNPLIREQRSSSFPSSSDYAVAPPILPPLSPPFSSSSLPSSSEQPTAPISPAVVSPGSSLSPETSSPLPGPDPAHYSDPSSSLSPIVKLFKALWEQDATTLAQELKNGAPVNGLNVYGLTPLYVAAHLGFLPGAIALVDRGADVNMLTNEGETPLFTAAQNGHAKMVEYLESKGADYNVVIGPTRVSALMRASEMGQLDVIKFLVRCKNISIDAQEAAYGMTALCFAAARGHTAIVSELLSFGADPNAKTWEYSTPLLIASANGHADIVRELCMKNADAGVQDKGGETALHRAVLGGHVETVLALVYVPSNPVVNIRNVHHATPLFIACALGNVELVRVLIQVGADMNSKVIHETPLSVALSQAHISVVLELLQCGVKHELEPQLVQTIITGTCSNLLGNNGCRQQFWFQCLDCNGVASDARVCLGCALVYHRAHTLRFHSFSYYMCKDNGAPPTPLSPLQLYRAPTY